MTVLRIRDFNGMTMTVETDKTPDEFNDMIDNAFATRNYSIRIGNGFSRIDVRNIASIEEVKQEAEAPQEEAGEAPSE